jgi:hypothetical protein
MRSGIVMSSEIYKAGVLNAAYYLDRKDGETYEQWRERDELRGWAAARIVTLETRLKDRPRKMTALVKLQRELARKELAELRKGLE